MAWMTKALGGGKATSLHSDTGPRAVLKHAQAGTTAEPVLAS